MRSPWAYASTGGDAWGTWCGAIAPKFVPGNQHSAAVGIALTLEEIADRMRGRSSESCLAKGWPCK
jgi:hypothetical protein